jgi:hypothetical protein
MRSVARQFPLRHSRQGDETNHAFRVLEDKSSCPIVDYGGDQMAV